MKRGTNRNNKPYTRYAVTDEGGMVYTTFSKTDGEKFEIGKSYGIAFWTKQSGDFTSREIEAVTPIDEDGDQIPLS